MLRDRPDTVPEDEQQSVQRTPDTSNLVLSVTSMIGNEIKNLNGEDLGTLDDVVIDVDTGGVAYAVLSFGGFLGLGEHYIAVPWQALQRDPDNERFLLDVNSDTLKEAPSLDRDNWPATPDNHWAESITRPPRQEHSGHD